MVEDFNASAVRHFVDAERLGKDGRHDNASHLIGISVECALKSSLEAIRGRKLPDSERCHLPKIASIYINAISGRTTSSSDPIRKLVTRSSAFFGWKVFDRYSPDGHVTSTSWSARHLEAQRIFAAIGMRKHSP